MKRIYAVVVFAPLFSSIAMASPFSATKNDACPDAWELTDQAIPVISASTNPWGVQTNDKDLAESHLVATQPIETIDAVPVTSDELVDDLLTVASACLVYRNFEVNSAGSTAPPSVAPNVSTGWIPAIL